MSGERRVAIVTGAARGIGRAMALGLLGAGIDVAALDKDSGPLAELAGDGTQGAGRLERLTVDLAEPGAADQAVADVMQRFGRVDILVNNAGIGQGLIRRAYKDQPIRFWEVPPETWRRFLDVNATAPFLMARAVVPHMMAAGWGRIVTVTTSLGTMLRPGYLPYGPTKASAEAAAAVMAGELAGTGVTVNVLVPGGTTNTDIVPPESGADRQAMLQPPIMVPPLLYLVSDAAGAITARRFLAVHWNPALPPDVAAEGAGAPIAWTSIATLPIEPSA